MQREKEFWKHRSLEAWLFDNFLASKHPLQLSLKPTRSKSFGFTLAEIAVTLVILGFVFAMTIPPLVHNVQEYTLKQAWKKEYSAISQAYLRVKQDHGGDLSVYFDSVVPGDTIPILIEIGNYLITQNNCQAINTVCGNNSTPSLTNAYSTLSGGYVDVNNLIYMQYSLRDGSNFYSRAYLPSIIIIWIDVNGYNKKPNKLGKDLFGLIITKDRVMPMGALGTGVENTCNATPKVPSSTYGFHPSGDIAGAGCSMEAIEK